MSVDPPPDAEGVLPLLAPMLAVIGPPPGPRTEAEYAYETLWNGARVIAHLPGDGSLRLLSQAGRDVTDQYPELETLALLLPGGEAVLDGEIVTLDEDGRPSVARLQQRMSLHQPQAVTHALADLPAQLMLYDILYLGEPVVQLPYTARRDLLDDLALTGPGISMPAAWPALADQALQHSLAEGFDGVVAKRLTSPYLPGRRTRDWIKIKHMEAERKPSTATG
ncbi:ATP-dependent DNA ligase [Streptomyces mirabilis]|uniref:ATP-dependent DNA ligase n=1 Tax=Streptomyces mirabilis TaxID=68239 RepID=UPI0037FE07AD